MESVETPAGEKIGKARFVAYGKSLYPDATFSLRLSYGQVKGWTYRGVTVEPFTYIGGLYERNTGAEPFNAAEDWLAAEGKVNKSTVYDFVSTNDIIGGNSGSPVINAKGEVEVDTDRVVLRRDFVLNLDGSGRTALSGIVRAANGKPAADAAVSVGPGIVSTRTDTQGRYALPNAPAGTQLIEARVIGARPVRMSVDLEAEIP